MTRAPDLIRRYEGEYGTHEHEHAQVLVGLDGNLELEVAGRSAFVDASCGLVVPAGVAHTYIATAPASVLVLDCEPQAAVEKMRRFAVPPGWRGAAAAQLDANALLNGLAGTRDLQVRRRLDLARLRQQVDAELHRDWNVADMAAACGFSAQRLRARFIEVVGMPPLAWLRRRRLDEAQRLLAAGMPLETAALQVGYATASALGFALRRDRGVGARLLRERDGQRRARR